MGKKTVYRWFWVWDLEKEEQWLNEMALQGWVLEHVGFCRFTFSACEPGEYSVRFEMHGIDPDYLDFMSDTGAEYIGRVAQWIYFRKKTELGAFDIFSDVDSRINHLSRISKMLFIIGMANLVLGINYYNKIGWINLLCSTLLMYALGRINGKKEALCKERSLHE